MTATPSAILAPAALNIGGILWGNLKNWFLKLWDKFPPAHWPREVWIICAILIFLYFAYWVWFHFIR
jgi:hypothetical protein